MMPGFRSRIFSGAWETLLNQYMYIIGRDTNIIEQVTYLAYEFLQMASLILVPPTV